MRASLQIDAVVEGRAIDVFNNGQMRRDFTFIDDIVAGVVAVLDRPAPPIDGVPHALYNTGNHRSEALMRFIELLSRSLGRTPKMNMLPMQLGDVQATYADTDPLQRDLGWRSTTTIDVGLPKFVAWYRDYYKVS